MLAMILLATAGQLDHNCDVDVVLAASIYSSVLLISPAAQAHREGGKETERHWWRRVGLHSVDPVTRRVAGVDAMHARRAA